MIWIYLIIIAQLLNAIVTLVDKHFVTSTVIGKPVVYTFYVAILSGVAILLLPFGVVLAPTMLVLKLSLMSSISFVFSLLFLYKSLKLSDASDVSPALGAVSAVATLGFSAMFLGQNLSGNFLYGFILLVIGTSITSYFHLTKKATIFLIVSGILFGLSTVFLKEIFNQTTFWNGFFWSRLANVVGAGILFVWPSNAEAIMNNVKRSSAGTKLAVVVNKIVAGVAFILILYAIKLGDTSLVNALAGIQFAFLLLLSVLFTERFPKYFYESVGHHHNILRKAVATTIIMFGLVVLFWR